MILLLLTVCAFAGVVITGMSLEAGLSLWGMIGVWATAYLLVLAIFAVSVFDL